MGEVQRWKAKFSGCLEQSDTGNMISFTDHAAKVADLERAVEVLGHMWQCETRVNLFAKLPENDSRKENAGRDFDAAYQRVLEDPIASAAIHKARNDANQ